MAAKGNAAPADWPDLIWMYLAFTDPQGAMSQFEAAEKTAAFESGNSRANTYHWIASLRDFGQVDTSVTADYPLYAVFSKGGVCTHCAYNMGNQARTVTFSDSARLSAQPNAWAMDK
jgi:hypothetical protein